MTYVRAWIGALALGSLWACDGGTSGPRLDGGAAGDGALNDDPDDGSSSAPECGNAEREPGEACDDGNDEGGDGCSADCTQVEPTYTCSVIGRPCLRTCGDGAFDDGEACDDGNLSPGDGCSATCTVEEGFGCSRPGAPCVELPVCGNGVRERGETCDAGDLSDPGCVDCAVQPGYFCAGAGRACLAERCGDGVRTPDEACDDGNTADGDGCSAACALEPGFRCGSRGCRPVCGDGVLRGGETCDDGNATSGDGCSGGCGLEPGKACPTPGAPCVDFTPTCGANGQEPGEACDDGNVLAGDGCGPTCQLEPTVTVGTNPVVNTRCGDGLKTGAESCDDGNAASGDGCSATCATEDGFTCTERVDAPPSSISFRVTYRDFKQRSEAGGHPHMRVVNTTPPLDGTDQGIAGAVCRTSNSATCGRLDAEGKPQYDAAGSHPTVNTQGSNYPDAFRLWYRSSNDAGIAGANGAVQVAAFSDAITLTRDPSGVYVYASDAFFPLDGRGFGTTPGQAHNFHFTTELRTIFQYQGGETLTFFGDDDVWVFINGRLAVDIGGIHGKQFGRVVLGDDGTPAGGDSTCTVGGATSEAAACSLSSEEAADPSDARFGLVKGNVYEIVLFNAERHPTGSNFKLTLSGFLAPRSYCTPVCGDGVVVGFETCDDGAQNRDGVYGVCNTRCTAKEECGDGVLQASHEACDNGFNLDDYAASQGACGPGCVLPPRCGDGEVQAPYELCDLGAQNADDAYMGCTTRCAFGPYCGDGRVDPGEQCDDGLGPNGNVGPSSDTGRCGFDCKPAFVLR